MSNDFQSQLAKVYEAFFEEPKTMKEVDAETGVMRESICRYCATLRKLEKLFPVKKRKCEITQHRAIAYTTNPELKPEDNQLRLF